MRIEQWLGQMHLQKEEEHGLDLVLGPGNNEHATVSPQVVSARNDCLDEVRHAVFDVDEVILGADQDPTRSIFAPWDRNQKIGSIVHWFRGLANDMIKAQVEFV